MNFRVYKSSAGSGKTYTLVREYLALILENPGNYSHILAVTFTNKAANEMKTRILDNLHDIGKGDVDSVAYKQLLPDLAEITGLSKEKVISNAAIVLSKILHNYSDFSVGTIDSFVHRIIRRFSFDLHLPGQFDVVVEEDDILTEAVDLLLSKAGFDEELTRTLIEFTESKAEEDKSWHIENDIFEFSKYLLKESAGPYTDKLGKLSLSDFSAIRNKLYAKIKFFENTIKEKGEEITDLISSSGISDEAFYRGKTGIPGYFRYLQEFRSDKLLPNSYVQTTLEEDKWFSGKASPADIAAIDSLKGIIGDAYLMVKNFLDKHLADYKLFSLVNRNIYTVALLNEIKKVINELKEQNNILLISDFNRKIAEVVQKEPVPYIYERAGEKYTHFLVDEFQDTSILQWQNLIPLFEESLSNGNVNMIVGDGKQAIYRWRNGEVEQFSCLPVIYLKEYNPIIAVKEDILKRNYDERSLNRNFRSRKEIVEFNNSFFETIALHPDFALKNIYDGCRQQADESKPGGFVNIEFIVKDSSKDEFEEANLLRIKEIIDELTADNYPPGDIAILCRSNFYASMIASYLMKHNIEVISSESMLLSSSPVIGFIICTLYYTGDPLNQVAVAGMLNYLFQQQKLQQDYLHSLIRTVKHKNGNFVRFLIGNGFDFDYNRLRSLPVYELCEEIIRIFRLNDKPDHYLQFFLDAVFEFTSKSVTTLDDIPEWWEEQKNKLSVISPEGLNAVRVMTIHKSKGLQFPVVIYPFANEKLKVTNSALWVGVEHPELKELPAVLIPVNEKGMEGTVYEELFRNEYDKSFLDMVNIVYVAMTRPVERLYVLSQAVNKKEQTIKAVPDLFKYYLNQTGLYDNDKLLYTFGNKEKKQIPEKGKEEARLVLNSMNSSDWRNRMILHTTTSVIPLSETGDRSRAWGNIMHYALSMMRTGNDLQHVLDKLVSDAYISEDEKAGLENSINQVLTHEITGTFFSEGLDIKMEAELVSAEGDFYRPDRVVFKADETIVIDYKTGKRDEKHADQLHKYARLLSEMGYNNISKYLVYLADEVEVLKIA